MSESRTRSTAKDDKAEEKTAEETGGLIFEEPPEESGASSMPVNTEWQDSAEREQEAAQEERVAAAEALEYCLAGAAPVVSLTEPYAAWTDGLALTAATPKEFLKQIRWLVSNRDAAPELAANGRTYALAERTIGRSIDCWREAVSGPRHRRYQKGNQET